MKIIVKHILTLIGLLVFSYTVVAQNPCDNANTLVEEYRTGSQNSTKTLYKALDLCPDNLSALKSLGYAQMKSSSSSKRVEGLRLYEKVLLINPSDFDATINTAIYDMFNGELDKAQQRILDGYAILNNKQESDSVNTLKHELNCFWSYIDTLRFAGPNWIKVHNEKYNTASFSIKRSCSIFSRDVLSDYMDVFVRSRSTDEVRNVVAFRLGLNKSYKVGNPYFLLSKGDQLYEAYNKQYATKVSDHSAGVSYSSYENIFEYYEPFLSLIPNHKPTLKKMADINYFLKEYDDCTNYFQRYLDCLEEHEKYSPEAAQTYRMIRRVEWLKKIDGEYGAFVNNTKAIKSEVLYHDKGRADDSMIRFGIAMSDAGLIATQSTGDISYAIAGTAVNSISMIGQKARVSMNWYWEAHEKKDWQTIYSKSNELLVRHINNSGFYSDETISLLIGIKNGVSKLCKPFNELKHHHRALIDIVYLSEKRDNYYITAAINAGLDLLAMDDELNTLERYRVCEMISTLHDIYVEENSKPFLSDSNLSQLISEKERLLVEIKQDINLK